MEKEFTYFKEWALKYLKIDLTAYKERQLHRRILSVMKSSGVENLYQFSKLIENDTDVKKKFLDYITINVTEFFRNKGIFDDFEEKFKSIISDYSEIKIWSAACSNGAEPYSIAIILDRIKETSKCKIIATDIDDTILTKAREGKYKSNQLKNLKDNEIKKYFVRENNEYRINEKIKKMVKFKKLDLIMDQYEKNFQLVVCRNVVIYFNNEARTNVYKKIIESIVPGGLFFVGATESISNPRELGLEKISTFLYQKL